MPSHPYSRTLGSHTFGFRDLKDLMAKATSLPRLLPICHLTADDFRNWLLGDAVARHYKPLLVDTVVGFIGPGYLFEGKQIIRAGLEDHFCAKLLGLPMGCDVWYTHHAEVDQIGKGVLLAPRGTASCNFVMGIPCSDDIMLNYQTTSFHDAL